MHPGRGCLGLQFPLLALQPSDDLLLVPALVARGTVGEGGSREEGGGVREGGRRQGGGERKGLGLRERREGVKEGVRQGVEKGGREGGGA